MYNPKMVRRFLKCICDHFGTLYITDYVKWIKLILYKIFLPRFLATRFFIPSPISQSNFIEITLWHGYCPINLMHIFRTCFSKNTSGWLPLNSLEVFNLIFKKKKDDFLLFTFIFHKVAGVFSNTTGSYSHLLIH